MKNFFFFFFFFFCIKTISNAQDYNRWSIEINSGFNRAIAPFNEGYLSANDNKMFGITSINHFDIGSRYMLNDRIGFKLDIANDKVNNQPGSSSYYFSANQNRLGLQTVINFGKFLNLQDISSRIGLLVHAGVQVAKLNTTNNFEKISENNGGFIFGFTPQIKVTNNWAATVDFSIISNIRQHLNWDGSYSNTSNNLMGKMLNASFGLTYYFGKNTNHADWDSDQTYQSSTNNYMFPNTKEQNNNNSQVIKVEEKQTSNEDFNIALDKLIKSNKNILYYDKNSRVTHSNDNLLYIINFIKLYPNLNIKLIYYTSSLDKKYKKIGIDRVRFLSNIFIKQNITSTSINVQEIELNFIENDSQFKDKIDSIIVEITQ